MKKLGAITIFLVPFFLAVSLRAAAQDTPSWFNSAQTLSVSSVAGEPFGKLDPYNAPCVNQSFEYYHFMQSNIASEGTRNECVHQANYGEISVLGGLRFKNGTKAYKLYTSESSYNSKIFPVVNSNHVFSPSGGAGLNREYIYIYKNLSLRTSLYTYPGINKQVFFKLTDPIITPANKVTFQNGEAPPIDSTTMSYAASGKFMLGSSVDYQAIINTHTLKARKIGFKTPNYSGAYPKVTTALSADGSLAFVATTDGLDARLYNLNQCSGATDGSVVENCQMTDMYAAIKAKLPSLKNVIRAQFTSDDTLYFKAKTNTSSGFIESWYRASLPGESRYKLEYMALGDSFASGEGAYDYKTGTDQNGNKCHVSLNSYSYLIKSRLNFIESEPVACSGAKQKDIRTHIQPDYNNDKPQANGRIGSQYDEEIFSQFLPGYRRQIDFVQRYKPRAITLSVGGNDIGFGEKIKECVLGPYDCYASTQQRDSILAEFKAQLPELSKTYTALKNASPESRLYIVGYPHFAKPDGSCGLNVRLSNEEIKLSEAMVADLNYIIKTATKKAGVFYVDAADMLNGHRMCETTKENTGFNGVTLGDDSGMFGFKFIGSESYHPNRLGHQLYTDKIIDATNGLSAAMPTADEATNLDNMPSRLKADPTTEGVSLPIPFMQQGGVVIKRGASLVLDTFVNAWLMPSSSFRIEIHSLPQQIGTAIAKDQETLSLAAQIPDTIEPGMHTLHVTGLDGMGKTVDFYKHIIVIADENDVDADGIENQLDNCPFLTPTVSSNFEDEFCVTAQSDNGVNQQSAQTIPVDSINPSAPSSENNSLTSPLGAPPHTSRISAPSDGLSRYVENTVLKLNETFGTNLPSSFTVNTHHDSAGQYAPTSTKRTTESINWNKYLITFSVGSSIAATALLGYRKLR